MNEISLDDVDFDSELQKLLDGGFGDAPEEKVKAERSNAERRK